MRRGLAGAQTCPARPRQGLRIVDSKSAGEVRAHWRSPCRSHSPCVGHRALVLPSLQRAAAISEKLSQLPLGLEHCLPRAQSSRGDSNLSPSSVQLKSSHQPFRSPRNLPRIHLALRQSLQHEIKNRNRKGSF